jgi:glycosyltransferase involved in cell wall biosynthesis
MTTAQPFVSIGVPLYNEARYLRQSPDALLRQDYSNFDLITSDNALTDSTAEKELSLLVTRPGWHRGNMTQEQDLNLHGSFDLARIITGSARVL